MDQFSFSVNGKSLLVYRSVYAPVKSNMFTIITGDEAIVFDPHEDEDHLSLLQDNSIKKVYILLTHGHYDHISGVQCIKERFLAEVFCQEKCANRLMNSKRPISRLVAIVLAAQDAKDGGHRYQEFKDSYKPFSIIADRTFDKEERFQIGGLELSAKSTPGHSEGSSCYQLFDKVVFSGDTLLRDTPVILKFPGGNENDYYNVAYPYLKGLDKESIIMPGHGDPFVLKDAKYL